MACGDGIDRDGQRVVQRAAAGAGMPARVRCLDTPVRPQAGQAPAGAGMPARVRATPLMGGHTHPHSG